MADTRSSLEETTSTTAHWLELCRQVQAEHNGSEPEVLATRRKQAIGHLEQVGFPTTRDELWRHTPVTPIVRTPHQRGRGERKLISLEQIGPWTYPDGTQLVFLDGRLIGPYSDSGPLPDGVVAGSLREALQRYPEQIERAFGGHADFGGHSFAALNTACWEDGAFLLVPAGVVLKNPLHILHLSSGGTPPTVSFPRNLIILETDSQATVVESYAGLAGSDYLSCGVSELIVGDYAVLEHYKIQQESLEARHLAFERLLAGRSAGINSLSISLGGGFVRNDLQARLEGEGTDCELNGLYLTRGTQFVDNHLQVDHLAPQCRSHELYKGILEGPSRGVFNGLIHVHPGAQKTDGIQTNRNLLLSREALVHTNPQLLIFADDVKCTHGSTVGRLDADALFYLRSRGIGEEAARSLLIYAFASELVTRIPYEPVRRDLEEFLFSRLPHGEIVRQAV